MYGGRKEFEGRITGFTMGTGQTLSLLPPQNATGNFVKIVQRLPVRIELTDYDPDKAPLFVGLSVTPYVYYKEPPTGPHAGEVLQPALFRRTHGPTPSPASGSKTRVMTDGTGVPQMLLPLHGRHRLAPRQPAHLRRGDAPHRAHDGEADPERSRRAGILEE